MPRVDPPLRVVVLAGGIGSRFWPASTPSRPKQLLPLASERPLIADTVARGLALVPPERLAVLAGGHLVDPFRRVLPELGPESFWVEARPRGTGPVLAWAAHRIQREDPSAVMVSLHADHIVEPEAAFRDLLRDASALAAREDLLLTVAAPPDRPEPGYGYIRPGPALPGAGRMEAHRVGAFVEKPDPDTARDYVARGYLWNTGIFLWPVARFLEEVRRHAPEIGRHLPLLDRGQEAAFFEAVPRISVDEAVLERSARVGTVRATFRWDDLGSWESLARNRAVDGDGNTAVGPVHAVRSRNAVAWSEEGPVVLFGVEDVVVVRAGGVTLVTSRAASRDLKTLVDGLPDALRDPEAGTDGRNG